MVVSLFQLWFLRDVRARDALVQSIIELWDWKLVCSVRLLCSSTISFLYPRLFFFIILLLWIVFGCPGQARLHSVCCCLAVLLSAIIFCFVIFVSVFIYRCWFELSLTCFVSCVKLHANDLYWQLVWLLLLFILNGVLIRNGCRSLSNWNNGIHVISDWCM